MTEPAPPKRGRGRPPGRTKTRRVVWLTTDARAERVQQLAAAAGLSVSAWLDLRIDKAR